MPSSHHALLHAPDLDLPPTTVRRRAWIVTAVSLAVFAALLGVEAAGAGEVDPPSPVASDAAAPAHPSSPVPPDAGPTTTGAVAPAPAPTDPPPVDPAPVDPAPVGGIWWSLAECESGGDWAAARGSFGGGLQIHAGTWRANGGTEFAARPQWATVAQQVEVAERIVVAHGGSFEAWPACARQLGLP